MDKRLVMELMPGPAFLIGNAIGGIFVGAGFATAATAMAVFLRWRWDRTLPLMAISILLLTVVLLGAGLVLDDTTFVKISNTLGSLAFALIVAFGMMLRPSLLRRTLGHSIRMNARGWRVLHIGWISLSVARAAANEAVWRTMSDDAWALYNGVSDIAWIALFFVVTSVLARRYWKEPPPPREAAAGD
ncbi:MAG: inner membrane-spanning protein YciB [Pikeienuella sp.]|uniref:inner membrane-spanning protein YciB n=1 Tax=Pikeienuella sp. TaxID=2831957 RepID=UPI00391C6919